MLLVTKSDGTTVRVALEQADSMLANSNITSVSITLNGVVYSIPTPKHFRGTIKWGSEVDKNDAGELLSVKVWCQAKDVRLVVTGYIKSSHFRADLLEIGEMRYRSIRCRH